MRARQACRAAGVDPPPWPRVSVLLATRRPALLAHAVANVSLQRYPHLELVLALHGPGFDPEAALAGFAHPVKVLRLDAERPLGSVLGAASAAASGPLLTKMDDDDIYGPEHLWDLVLAHEYSGAALVGKFPATVYLPRLDRTVRQRTVASETVSRSITGGTMLLAMFLDVDPGTIGRIGDGKRRATGVIDVATFQSLVRGGTVADLVAGYGGRANGPEAGHTARRDCGSDDCIGELRHDADVSRCRRLPQRCSTPCTPLTPRRSRSFSGRVPIRTRAVTKR